jgi:hypothetical protein
MPEDSGAAPKPELPDYVKRYFEDRHLNPDKLELLPRTRELFASHLSEAQVQLLDRIGVELELDLKHGGGVDPGDAPQEEAPENKPPLPSYRFMIH